VADVLAIGTSLDRVPGTLPRGRRQMCMIMTVIVHFVTASCVILTSQTESRCLSRLDVVLLRRD